jgi:hypothetical protein
MAGPRGTVPNLYSHWAASAGPAHEPLAAKRSPTSDSWAMRPVTQVVGRD